MGKQPSSVIGCPRPAADIEYQRRVSVEFQEILEGQSLSIELDQSLTFAGLSLCTVEGTNARSVPEHSSKKHQEVLKPASFLGETGFWLSSWPRRVVGAKDRHGQHHRGMA